jgi:3-ketosteroid 9alpha-monooxygenase subunit A
VAKSSEYGMGEFTYPRGWFMVADAEKVTHKPSSVRFFGNDMVVYRGASGNVVMLDAYCPHMGTHLGKNTTAYAVAQGQHVVGDSIQCPYHGWRFGPDGKCNHIPYFSTIPPAARVKAYPVIERYNGVFFWNDPEGGTPDYELPHIPEWDDAAWIRWHFDDLGTMNLHPIEVVDNISDVAHLQPVHATTVQYFENELRGHKVTQRLGGAHVFLGGDGSDFNTFYTGPGILISRFLGDKDSLMFITHTPVDDGVVKVWHAVLTRGEHDVATDEERAAAAQYQKVSLESFAGDFEIWSNKRPCFQPMRLPTDGNFGVVRNWYKQFYNPRAAVPAILAKVEGIYHVPGIPSAPPTEARRAALLRAG